MPIITSITANTSKKNRLWLFSILAISLLLRILFIGNPDLLIEEAYYWNYGLHLDFGYLDHPPLIAVLIKCSTAIFGLNELGVRFPALLAWFITAYFSYKLSVLIAKGTGLYALLLVAILPGFFIFSIIMTPDILLMAGWSTGLYMLYRALIGHDSTAWYYAGIAVGLGLLGKYTMVLLIFTTGIYLLATPKARFWFGRKEPYLAMIIALILFSPVIYWNATHDWVSFAFQSTRRFQDVFRFTFHHFVGILILFLTPVGIIGFYQLLQKQAYLKRKALKIAVELDNNSLRFIRYFLLIPLAVFATFSLTRGLKFDWIAPAILGIIPWLAILIQNQANLLHKWFITAVVLLIAYSAIFVCIGFGQPTIVNQKLFNKAISWDNLTLSLRTIANNINTLDNPGVFVPIDSYGISSELIFYQAKQVQEAKKEGRIIKSFPVYSAKIFGFNGLMFNFWTNSNELKNKNIILISKDSNNLKNPAILRITTAISPVVEIWAISQGNYMNLKPYYYQVVRLNE